MGRTSRTSRTWSSTREVHGCPSSHVRCSTRRLHRDRTVSLHVHHQHGCTLLLSAPTQNGLEHAETTRRFGFSFSATRPDTPRADPSCRHWRRKPLWSSNYFERGAKDALLAVIFELIRHTWRSFVNSSSSWHELAGRRPKSRVSSAPRHRA